MNKSRGVKLIAAERARQVDVENWTSDHDDYTHNSGELASAAISYAMSAIGDDRSEDWWPWEDGYKPKDPMRDLVRAGALIAAEIDAMLRLQETQG